MSWWKWPAAPEPSRGFAHSTFSVDLPNDGPKTSIYEMLKRIERLEAKVAELEKRA